MNEGHDDKPDEVCSAVCSDGMVDVQLQLELRNLELFQKAQCLESVCRHACLRPGFVWTSLAQCSLMKILFPDECYGFEEDSSDDGSSPESGNDDEDGEESLVVRKFTPGRVAHWLLWAVARTLHLCYFESGASGLSQRPRQTAPLALATLRSLRSTSPVKELVHARSGQVVWELFTVCLEVVTQVLPEEYLSSSPVGRILRLAPAFDDMVFLRIRAEDHAVKHLLGRPFEVFLAGVMKVVDAVCLPVQADAFGHALASSASTSSLLLSGLVLYLRQGFALVFEEEYSTQTLTWCERWLPVYVAVIKHVSTMSRDAVLDAFADGCLKHYVCMVNELYFLLEAFLKHVFPSPVNFSLLKDVLKQAWSWGKVVPVMEANFVHKCLYFCTGIQCRRARLARGEGWQRACLWKGYACGVFHFCSTLAFMFDERRFGSLFPAAYQLEESLWFNGVLHNLATLLSGGQLASSRGAFRDIEIVLDLFGNPAVKEYFLAGARGSITMWNAASTNWSPLVLAMLQCCGYSATSSAGAGSGTGAGTGAGAGTDPATEATPGDMATSVPALPAEALIQKFLMTSRCLQFAWPVVKSFRNIDCGGPDVFNSAIACFKDIVADSWDCRHVFLKPAESSLITFVSHDNVILRHGDIVLALIAEMVSWRKYLGFDTWKAEQIWATLSRLVEPKAFRTSDAHLLACVFWVAKGMVHFLPKLPEYLEIADVLTSLDHFCDSLDKRNVLYVLRVATAGVEYLLASAICQRKLLDTAAMWELHGLAEDLGKRIWGRVDSMVCDLMTSVDLRILGQIAQLLLAIFKLIPVGRDMAEHREFPLAELGRRVCTVLMQSRETALEEAIVSCAGFVLPEGDAFPIVCKLQQALNEL